MRNRQLIPALLYTAVLLAGLLAGCGAQEEATVSSAAEASSAEISTPTAQAEGGGAGEPAAPPEGGEDGPQGGPGGPGGFGEASQLALNTLYLQSTDFAITAEQAEILLPYWQELKTLQEGGQVDSEQVAAVVAEIEGELTDEQTAFLADVSQEDLAAWAQEQGYMVGFGGPRSDMEGENPPEMSDEERATAQAARSEGPPEDMPEDMPEGPPEGSQEGTSPAAPAASLVDEVISMLESLITG